MFIKVHDEYNHVKIINTDTIGQIVPCHHESKVCCTVTVVYPDGRVSEDRSRYVRSILYDKNGRNGISVIESIDEINKQLCGKS